MITPISYPSLNSRCLLVDTGPLLSLANSRDSQNGVAKTILSKIKKQRYSLLITKVTIYEAYTRILYDVGWDQAIAFLDDIYSSNMLIEPISSDDEKAAEDLLRKYKHMDISYIDALNFAVMLRLKYLYAFTFDNDYLILGFQKFF